MTKTIVRKYVLTLSLSILMGLTGTNLCSATNVNPDLFFSNTEDLLKAAKQPIPTPINEFSPNTYDLLREEERQLAYKSWKTFGNFSDIQNYGNVPLDRQFRLKPLDLESNIDKVDVLGYKNNNISIIVSLKKEDPNLFQKLRENLLNQDWIFKKQLISINLHEIDRFLNVFVEEDLIPYSVRDQILKEIKFDNLKKVPN